MSFLLTHYHRTVCLASGVGKSSLVDRVSRVEEATGKPCHIVFGDWCVTNLVGCGRSRSHSGKGRSRHPKTWQKNISRLKPNFLFCTTLKGSNEGILKPLVPCLNSFTSNAMSDESLTLKDQLHTLWKGGSSGPLEGPSGRTDGC